MRDLVFVIFAIAGLAMIQARTAQASPNLVQLKLYSSPSLKWELEVDPSDRHGRGKGSYRMLNRGKEVWKVEIPCTLCDAIVADDGVTIGYGYGHGIEGFGAGGFKDGPGTLDVVIIDATGKVRLNDAIKREWSSYPHGFPVPCVREFVVHTAESQFALRLSGDDNEQWSAYRTETGERITNYSHNYQVAAGPKSKPLSLVRKNVDSLPIRELQALGSFVLGAPPEVQVIRDIAEFAFDEHGRIGFLRRERTVAMTIVIIDQDSQVIAESVLPLSDPSQSCIEWIAGERWIVTASGYGEDAKAQAWWFDAQKQTFSQIRGFHSPAVEKVCRANDGGFVVLATKRSRYQSIDSVERFDASGKCIWGLVERSDDTPSSLFSPESIAVTTLGELAVLDNIHKVVQVFNLEGTFLRRIDLEAAWKCVPRYPSGITADADGGFFVHDFKAQRPYIHMNSDGKVLAGFALSSADGRSLDANDRIRISPDSKLWASDGHSISLVSDQGVVIRTLGPTPTDDHLGKIAALTVDNQGCIYAVDQRTGATHVFSPDGERLRVCRPDMQDFHGDLRLPHISVDDDGSVFINDHGITLSSGHLHFDALGTRVGIKALGFDTILEKWYPQPGSAKMLVLGYEAIALFQEDGEEFRKIERRPDRRWLGHPETAAFADDGTFAVLSNSGDPDFSELSITLYNVEGLPTDMFVLPFSPFAVLGGFNGRLLSVGSKDCITVYDRAGKQIGCVTKTPHWRTHFLVRNGRELCVVDVHSHKTDRYALP